MTGSRSAVVQQLTSRPAAALEIDSNWDQPPWANLPILSVDQFMGDRPTHFPAVEARLGWDSDAVSVIFRVHDAFVCATAERHQDCVCKDSCVEWFFCPGTDIENGYFNFEINCGGTILFHFQRTPRRDMVPLPEEALAAIEVSRSLPRIVEPEIAEPIVWTIEARIPLSILEPFRTLNRPSPGVVWRSNLYKCG
ncbi:MAG: carbohydrate-binding family 9-like protein, partial [Verrucomicrobia bacterium]|nr:carbohydrate-binding family 9-like protein [Verrucomicrobiota bacterium]